MLNQVIIVGRVLEINQKDSGVVIILEVDSPRDDITREIPVKIEENLVKSMDYISVGTTLGTKAHIETTKDQTIEIVAEKLTFINSKGSD